MDDTEALGGDGITYGVLGEGEGNKMEEYQHERGNPDGRM